MRFLDKICTHISDPEVVEEILTTKNKFVDKNVIVRDMFVPIFGNGWPVMKATDQWRVERKACAPMFYKQKLTIMC